MIVQVPVAGQGGIGSPLIPLEVSRPVGLERAWHAQLAIDAARARVEQVTIHVNQTETLTVYDVTDGDKTVSFTEHHTDRFGVPLGPAGAAREAERRMLVLRAQGGQPKLATRNIPRVTLYVVTSLGIVHALDGETGATRWVVRIGHANYPTLAPGASDGRLAIVNGSTLYVLDPASGRTLWERKLGGGPGAGPALSDEYVFVPLLSGELEAYGLKNPVERPWIYKSAGRALVQPTVTPSSVSWPTDRGLMYVANANHVGIRFRLETRETIDSASSYLGPYYLLVASVDGYAYCVQEVSSDLLWRYSAGSPIRQAPIPIGDAVHVITDRDGMCCVSLDKGEERWWAPSVTGFLAASRDRIYVSDRTGQITVLDARSGGRIASMPGQYVDLRVPNLLTDRVYVGSRTGTIQCLREIGAVWPTIHLYDSVEAKKKPEIVQKVEPEGPPPLPPGRPPGGDDPFGGAGADNPFAAGAPPQPDKAPDQDDPLAGPPAVPPAGPDAAPPPPGGGPPVTPPAGADNPFGAPDDDPFK